MDRFYLGKIGTGILKLITLGGFGLWSIIDLIIILCGGMTDKYRRPLVGYAKHKMIAWIISIVLIVLGGILGITGMNGAVSGAPTTAAAPTVVEQPEASSTTVAEEAAADEPAADEPAAEVKPAEATWQEVITIDGKTDKASKVFELTGNEARMTYSFKGGEDMALGAIYLLDEGTDLMKDGGLPEAMIDGPISDESALHKSAGKYFLDVNAANFDGWSITIEEKR